MSAGGRSAHNNLSFIQVSRPLAMISALLARFSMCWMIEMDRVHNSPASRATVAGLLFGLTVSAFVQAAPPIAVYLTWQGNTSTSITVNYLTEELSARSIVYFDTESQEGEALRYRRQLGGRGSTLPGLPSGPKVHRVQLTGLFPGRDYFFVAGDPRTGMTEERKFRTLPNGGEPIRFVVGGDMGLAPEVRALCIQAARQEPQFALIGGDIAYANGTPRNWARWRQWLSNWSETMVTPKGYTVPVTLAIGNHEVQGGYDQRSEKASFYFALFGSGTNASCFRMQFGSFVPFYFLDSGHLASHASQVPWLEEVLRADQGLPYRFALYHIPLYPSHRSFTRRLSAAGRTHWAPLFDRYGLTTAFETHEHTFKRSRLLRNNAVAADGEGVLYLGDGGWGGGAREIYLKSRWYLDKVSSTLHFWRVDVSKEKVEYRAFDDHGGLFDIYPSNSAEASEAEAYFATLKQAYMLPEEALIIEPIWIESPKFRREVVTIELSNIDVYPADAEIALVTEIPMRVKPARRHLRLAAGETKRLSFKLVAAQSLFPADIPLSRIQFIMTFALPDRTLRIERSENIGVERRRSVPFHPDAVEIDGVLGEWADLPIEVVHTNPREIRPADLLDFWEGPGDASGRFAVRRDEESLYMAIRVVDDVLQQRSDPDPWRQDALVFWVDVFPGGQDHRARFALLPASDPERRFIPFSRAASVFRGACLPAADGYQAEVSVPLAFFRELADETGSGALQQIRLNIAISDKDRDGQKALAVFWRPAWGEELDFSWSGVFDLR